MIDRDLERRTADCTELMETWRQFLDLVIGAVRPPHNTTPQAEEVFLATKARIAMLHDSFMDSLEHDKAVGTNMLEIVNRAITLRIMRKMNEPEIKKMEIEWHEVFLLVNETVTSLNDERERVANINEFAFNLGKFKDRTITNMRGWLTSIYFKLLVVLLAIVFIVWGVPALGIYDWDKLRDVKVLKVVLQNYYWFTREYLNWESPFYSPEEFITDFDTKANLIPGISEREKRSNVTTQEISAGSIANVLFYAKPAEAHDTLMKAAAYEVFALRFSGSEKRVFAYIYWYRLTSDARYFESLAKQLSEEERNASDFRIFRKVNVIVIIQGSDLNARDTTITNTVRKMPPIE